MGFNSAFKDSFPQPVDIPQQLPRVWICPFHQYAIRIYCHSFDSHQTDYAVNYFKISFFLSFTAIQRVLSGASEYIFMNTVMDVTSHGDPLKVK